MSKGLFVLHQALLHWEASLPATCTDNALGGGTHCNGLGLWIRIDCVCIPPQRLPYVTIAGIEPSMNLACLTVLTIGPRGWTPDALRLRSQRLRRHF